MVRFRHVRLGALLASSSLAALLAGTGAPSALTAACKITQNGGTVASVSNSSPTGNCILVENGASVTGDVTNTSTGVLTTNGIAQFSRTGISIYNATVGGSVSNAGTIIAGDGIVVYNNATVSGAVANSGTIAAAFSGIIVGGLSTFAGGISNGGVISASQTGIRVNTISNFSGGITNSATIAASGSGITANTISSFGGGISNSGTISAGYNGINVHGDSTFTGGITNGGLISAASGAGIVVSDMSSFSGGISNGGTISAGASGAGILVSNISTFNGGISNSGTISVGGVGITVGTTNRGTDYGVTTFTGNISNSGTISAATGIAILGSTIAGAIIDSGTILAASHGILIDSTSRIDSATSGIYVTGRTFTGGITNAGTIVAGETGIKAADVLNFSGGITNSGTISGGATGAGIVVVFVPTFAGGISNSGMISAGAFEPGINVAAITNFAGGISNSGTISAGGTGIYVFAISTFLGGITNSGAINAKTGVIVGDVATFQGAIVNSGTITGTGGTAIDISAAPDMTIDVLGGAIGGNMTGAGTTNGDTVNFNLGGTFAYGSTISGMQTVAVNSGTLFDGGAIVAGSVNVNAGGVLAPGLPHTIGTLNITGSLVFASAAAYLETISGASASKTAVTGSATLGGASVAIAGGSTITNGTKYTILSDTAGGIGGSNTFAGAISYNGETGTLSYDADDVYLTFASATPQNLLALLPPGAPANVVNVANGIDNFINGGGTLPAQFSDLFNLTPPQLVNALTRIDGESNTGASSSTFQLFDAFFNLLSDMALGTGGGGSPGSGVTGFAEPDAAFPPELALAYNKALKKSAAPQSAPQSFDQRWTAWGSAYGGAASYNGSAAIGSNNLTASDFGFAGGMDYHAAPDLKLGFALAGGGTNWNLAQNLGGGRSDAVQIAGYGIKHYGPLYFTAMAAFGNSWFTTSRIAAFSDQLRATFDGQSYGLRGESGYRFAMTPTSGLTPYAAVQTQWLRTPGYSETDLTGGGFGLTYNAQTSNDTRSELGARADDLTMLGNLPLILRGRLAWAHDRVSNTALGAVFQTLPGAAFTVNGAAVPANSALLSAGGQLFFSPNWSIEAKFDSELASAAKTYSGTGTLRYTW